MEKIPKDKIEELSQVFNTIDSDGNGYLSAKELGEALKVCDLKVPEYEIRKLLESYDTNVKDNRLDIIEFQKLYSDLKKMHSGIEYRKQISNLDEGVEVIGGGMVGITHSIRMEEQLAFSKWINNNLTSDVDCKRLLPLKENGEDLYEKCGNGILLCKMINIAQPGVIDERTINKEDKLKTKFAKIENLTLALKSAQGIGCCIVNIGAEDLLAGIKHLILGLLWQIIRIGLLAEINLQNHPGLIHLLNDGETIEDLMRLSPEQILIRWVNYHLANSPHNKAGPNVRITNFGKDISDSIAYTYLLEQIAPKDSGIGLSALDDKNVNSRAEKMLGEADKINCRAFVDAEQVVKGNQKLNLAFVANLFNNHPALDKVNDDDILGQIIDETREEKMYRNWMNSLGVNPFVNHLYSDLNDGLIFFQLFEYIKPGSVDQARIVKRFSKMQQKRMLEELANCNYAIELGKKFGFSLVGIDGSNLTNASKHKSYALSLIWQLMKAYTISVLSKLSHSDKPIPESTIVNWANEKLSSKSKSITGFNDSKLSDGVIIIDLIEAIKKDTVTYSLLKKGSNEEEKMSNAKLAISYGKKIGASIYALPEDIVEVKQKMVMTIFACLMIVDLEKKAN